MRLIGLSIIAAALFATGAASAQELVHEPQGQVFTPPPVRIEHVRGVDHGDAIELSNRAKAECSAWVAEVYSFRDRIYVACLREKLEPVGYRVTVLNDEYDVARRFGIATN